MTTLTIPATYSGPPDSGNGGFTAGSLAHALLARAAGTSGAHVDEAELGAAVEVTLRAPAPLERPLAVDVADDGSTARLVDGEVLVAEARRLDDLDVTVPSTVPFDDAVRLQPESRMLRGVDEHPFPSCFVCSPVRHDADALRLFPVRAPGTDVFVAPFVRDDVVTYPLTWAALDCPSSFPMYLDEDPFDGPIVLGRIAARVDARPHSQHAYVVHSWREAVDGRKLHTASAIVDDEHGTPIAVARATWVRLRQ